MWCVLQVRPGHEHAMAVRVRRVAGDTLRDCFVLERQALRRVQGEWSLNTEIMYPGYVFLVVADLQSLRSRLQDLSAFGQLVEADGQLSVLSDDEIAFITAFGGADHLVRFSRGNIVDGQLVVYEGPLQGRASLVKKIDRHKRIARLGTGGLGSRGATVGLEVVSKT